MRIEKGKALPLTHKEKVGLSINYLCRDLGNQDGMAYWARDVVIDDFSVSSLDEDRERVTARGSFVLNRRRLRGKNVNLTPVAKKFNVTLEDIKDEMGLPDIKVIDGKVTDKK